MQAPAAVQRRHRPVRLVGSETAALITTPDSLRFDALRILRAGVEGVNPVLLTTQALTALPVFAGERMVGIIAAGKAACPMMRAALQHLGDRVRAGVVTGPREGGDFPPGIQYFHGAHPLPDDISVASARAALDLAAATRASGDIALVLLSGGASAMLAAPANGLSLDDKRRTTDQLLRSGADIQQLNAVRKHISAIKGGQLGVIAGRSVTLALSDVHEPKDDPATIGSGPAVADPTTYAQALDVLRTHTCDVPPAVLDHLSRGAAGEVPETPKPADPRLAACAFHVIGNRRTAMDAAAAAARRLGFVVHLVDAPTGGEARIAGRRFADLALAVRQVDGAFCAIASGEPTVTVRGDGKGGRNQEFALGAADVLAQSGQSALLASIGTDGVDGPTDAAGAIVTSTTVSRAAALGLDIDDALARNDAYPLLARLDDLVRWGPTLTNVGDLHILLTMSR